jgi:hypothetical protein
VAPVAREVPVTQSFARDRGQCREVTVILPPESQATGLRNVSVDLAEALRPLVVCRKELRKGLRGAGRRRCGPGRRGGVAGVDCGVALAADGNVDTAVTVRLRA